MKWLLRILITGLLPLILLSCGKRGNEVVIYVALDQQFSRPILDRFEKGTGIKVRDKQDTEQSKTTGLVTTLMAEKNNPRCDVFWNNEIVQTIRLKKKGVLAPYHSPEAQAYPGKFKDPEGYWTGLAARARVILYNTHRIQGDIPQSIFDLADPKWKGMAGIAKPIFGTTASHAAVLFEVLGEEKAREYFESLLKNDVTIADGNAHVMRLVGSGELAFGLTDTDDASVAKKGGKPVEVVFPDQEGLGTLLIPNTVALIQGCPNPENGKKLIDFILSVHVEEALAASTSRQIPLNPKARVPEGGLSLKEIGKVMEADLGKAADRFDEVIQFIKERFIR